MASHFLERELDKLVKRSRSEDAMNEVRFSITVSKLNNRRIEYVRRLLRLSKQELLHDIIIAAIGDLEVRLGLTEVDSKTGEGYLKPEYEKIINSKKSIASFFKGNDED